MTMGRSGAKGGALRGGATAGTVRHIPVLLSEMISTLAPANGETYIDGTFGAGGYTRAILTAADCSVIAIDQDPDAVAGGQSLVTAFSPRLRIVQANFSSLDDVARQAGFDGVDGVVLDIGVSSMQLDEAARGFSFMRDGPLDMRMGQSGPSAGDVVMGSSEAELASILKHLGEERRARKIAHAIVGAREAAPLERTGQLAAVVEGAIGRKPGDDKHPATRTFQALRLYVNRELESLALALSASERILKPGGRLVVVSFHSLEDRIVKRFMRQRGGRVARGSRHVPEQSVQFEHPSFQIINSRPLEPGNHELETNVRARSARLRAAVRTEAPAHGLDLDQLGLPRLQP